MNGLTGKPVGNRDQVMAPHGCYRCQGEYNLLGMSKKGISILKADKVLL